VSLPAEHVLDATPAPRARLVVALPHTRLQDAISAALGSSGEASVVGRAGTLAETIRIIRESQPDGVVVGSGLLQGDVVQELRRLVAAIPGVRVVVLGTETSAAYRAAMKLAGAADYVALDGGFDGVLSAVLQAPARGSSARA
jgi:DNA-binding NarL/FixJ family response regulator